MAKKDGVDFKVKLDPKLKRFANQFPEQLKQGREKAVEAAGMAWADEAKELTRSEDHIDTGLYINSIGYATGTPNSPLYEMNSSNDSTVLTIGADVAYAAALEKRYAIFARSLDTGKSKMQRVATKQVERALGL